MNSSRQEREQKTKEHKERMRALSQVIERKTYFKNLIKNWRISGKYHYSVSRQNSTSTLKLCYA